jgi:hypothetical protein
VFLASCWSNAIAAEGQTTTQQVDAWLQKQVADASDDRLLRGLAVTWDSIDLAMPSKDEIARMRREVPGHPDHPERGLLAQVERKLKGEFPAARRTAWCFAGGRVRLNTDSGPDSSQGYMDLVLTPDEAWGMTPEGLDIIDPSRPDPGYDYRAVVPNYLFEARELVSMGASLLARIPDATWEAATVDSKGRWEKRGRDGRGYSWRVEGAADGGQLTIHRITATDGATGAESSTRMSDHRREGIADRWVAGAIEYFEGRPPAAVRRLILHEVRVADESLAANYLRVPNVDQEDAFRGRPKYSMVRDMRTGERAFRKLADGQVQVEVPLPDDRTAENSRWVSRTGWVMAGLLVAALVLLRVRKSGH